MKENRKQTVLITGASSGLGLALARELQLRLDLRLILTARESSIPRFADAAERRGVVSEAEEEWEGIDIIRARRPPLRVQATIDARIFSLLRRCLPQRLFHFLLRKALPRSQEWGQNSSLQDGQ
ncbi:MAG: NAD(P)-dependent dehydrogenase (short-subunit alcohol dehydrogenase family) [Verrucomicrobiales bacterium]|jgi:NAD(P)-dependent dehydrogenase (short-subunit alcohol dehydrogenase family)